MIFSGLITVDSIPEYITQLLRIKHGISTITECYLYDVLYTIKHIIGDSLKITTEIWKGGKFKSSMQKMNINDVPFTVLEGFMKVRPDSIALAKVWCNYVLEEDGKNFYKFSLDHPEIETEDGILWITEDVYIDPEGTIIR